MCEVMFIVDGFIGFEFGRNCHAIYPKWFKISGFKCLKIEGTIYLMCLATIVSIFGCK